MAVSCIQRLHGDVGRDVGQFRAGPEAKTIVNGDGCGIG
jgi:hypothetical protein